MADTPPAIGQSDTEIAAIAACVEAIDPFVSETQDRILDYLCARFGRRMATEADHG